MPCLRFPTLSISASGFCAIRFFLPQHHRRNNFDSARMLRWLSAENRFPRRVFWGPKRVVVAAALSRCSNRSGREDGDETRGTSTHATRF